MKTSTKIFLITIFSAVPAFLLGDVIWPASPGITPSSAQLPFFIVLAVLEAVAFGVGLSFIILGWKRAQNERVAFLASAWLLISWWPHDNMHKHNGEDLAGLLVIEYLFHVTLIIAAFIIARYMWRQLQSATLEGAHF